MNEEDIKDNLRKMLFNSQQANSCGLSNNDFIEEIRTLSSALDLLDKKDKEIDKKDRVIFIMTEHMMIGKEWHTTEEYNKQVEKIIKIYEKEAEENE